MEPDHATCSMPQEIRRPEYRTDDFDETTSAIVQTHNLIAANAQFGLSDLVMQLLWPELSQSQAFCLLYGLPLLYHKATEKGREVPQAALTGNRKRFQIRGVE